jgi:phage-related holin
MNDNERRRGKRIYYAVKVFLLLVVAEYLVGVLIGGTFNTANWPWEFRASWFSTWSLVNFITIVVALSKYKD